MRSLLRPNAKTVTLFMLFAVIAVGGYVQAGAFGRDDGPRHSERFLNLPLWEAWVLLGAPVHLLFGFVERDGPRVVTGRGWTGLYFAAQVIYFYLLAAVLVAIADSAARRLRRRPAH